jgi:hypothetical protein
VPFYKDFSRWLGQVLIERLADGLSSFAKHLSNQEFIVLCGCALASFTSILDVTLVITPVEALMQETRAKIMTAQKTVLEKRS